MIYGIGVDICENVRIRKMVEKYNDSFLRKIFLEEEIEYCKEKRDPVPHLAARFAMKEAFIKAVGWGTMSSYKEIGLVGEDGKKDPKITGLMAEKLKSLKIENIFCSISHADHYSTAMVVLEK